MNKGNAGDVAQGKRLLGRGFMGGVTRRVPPGRAFQLASAAEQIKESAHQPAESPRSHALVRTPFPARGTTPASRAQFSLDYPTVTPRCPSLSTYSTRYDYHQANSGGQSGHGRPFAHGQK